MIAKIKEFIKGPRFKELFRFGVNGAVCAVVDAAIMYVLMNYTAAADWLAIGVGFTVSVILNYILCVVWVFKGAGKQSLASRLVFVGSSVIGLVLTEILMLLFITFMHELVAKVIVTVIVMIWNYFMKRIAIYGFKKK